MDIKEHKQEFDKIIEKYNLKDEEKAEEIANFLINSNKDKVSAEEFAKLFAMTKKEAMIFLSFIGKGIKFKEEHMDNK